VGIMISVSLECRLRCRRREYGVEVWGRHPSHFGRVWGPEYFV